jgi:L-amino acid N-acyltransferase YncA
MKIREANSADAEPITDAHIASILEAYGSIFGADELARIDARDRAERWRNILTDGSSVTLLAEADGSVVGFASFGACRDDDVPPGAVGELMAIYIRPDMWGRGFGQALMKEALAQLRSKGSDEVVLWVIESNRRAIRFYRQFGFVPDGSVRVREMYGTPTAVVRLRRRADLID